MLASTVLRTPTRRRPFPGADWPRRPVMGVRVPAGHSRRCGWRPEGCSLRLGNRLLAVTRSCRRDATKGGHADVIPIATELQPYLADAVVDKLGRSASTTFARLWPRSSSCAERTSRRCKGSCALSPALSKLNCIGDLKLVGATGYEPAASCSQSRRATRLRYAPDASRPASRGLGILTGRWRVVTGDVPPFRGGGRRELARWGRGCNSPRPCRRSLFLGMVASHASRSSSSGARVSFPC